MKYLFILFGVVFCGLFFLSPMKKRQTSPVGGDDKVRAYDDESKLDEILKDDREETLADLKRRNGEQEATAALNSQKPTLDAPPPPSQAPMKYDDAEWHYGGDFPEDAPISYGFTHIGFFLTWIVDSGLESEFIQTEAPSELAATKSRSVSPIALLEYWDGKLVDDMLSDEGNAFAASYYDMSKAEAGYFADYSEAFSEAGAYEVAPSWENYDRIKPVIDRRYRQWKAENAKP